MPKAKKLKQATQLHVGKLHQGKLIILIILLFKAQCWTCEEIVWVKAFSKQMLITWFTSNWRVSFTELSWFISLYPFFFFFWERYIIVLGWELSNISCSETKWMSLSFLWRESRTRYFCGLSFLSWNKNFVVPITTTNNFGFIYLEIK